MSVCWHWIRFPHLPDPSPCPSESSSSTRHAQAPLSRSWNPRRRAPPRTLVHKAGISQGSFPAANPVGRGANPPPAIWQQDHAGSSNSTTTMAPPMDLRTAAVTLASFVGTYTVMSLAVA